MKTGVLDLESLDRDYLCVIQLRHQVGGVLHQVTLSPEKVHDGIIRLGEFQNDEANGWQLPENINVLAVLGVVVKGPDGQLSCRPSLEVVQEAA